MPVVRQELIEESLKALSLNPAHLDIIGLNPAHINPYHNNEHLYTVALNCLEAAKYYNLSRQDERLLLLAGLYHDYAHSGGKHSDTINVSKSISYALHHCEELEKLSDEETDKLANIIHATIQPSTLHNADLNLLQKIIMDADMMQWLEPDADDFLVGLSVEMGREITWHSTKEFLENYVAKTDWGKHKIEALVSNLY